MRDLRHGGRARTRWQAVSLHDLSRSADSRPPVALVTGSSRGLGAHIAQRLAQDGFTVAVNAWHDAASQGVVDHIHQAGGRAAAFGADVTDESSARELITDIERTLGPLTVVTLNATGPQPEAQVIDVDWSDHLNQLSFFVKSPVVIGRAAIPGMQTRRYGRIINIDSEIAFRPPVGRSAYTTAKSAQIGLTMAWARELAPWAITVNTVAPGFIPVERHTHLPRAAIADYLATVPAGRMGTPNDIASAVSFLASADASFITGQRITVDGGRSLT